MRYNKRKLPILTFIIAIYLSTFMLVYVNAQSVDAFDDISFIQGPNTINIKSSNAKISIPEGLKFLSGANTKNILSFLGIRADVENISIIMPKQDTTSTAILCVYKPVGHISKFNIIESDFPEISNAIMARNGLELKNTKFEWEKVPTTNAKGNMFIYIAKMSQGFSDIIEGRAVFLGKNGYFTMNFLTMEKNYKPSIITFISIAESFTYNLENAYSPKNNSDSNSTLNVLQLAKEDSVGKDIMGSFLSKSFVEMAKTGNLSEPVNTDSRKAFKLLLEIAAVFLIIKAIIRFLKNLMNNETKERTRHIRRNNQRRKNIFEINGEEPDIQKVNMLEPNIPETNTSETNTSETNTPETNTPPANTPELKIPDLNSDKIETEQSDKEKP